MDLDPIRAEMAATDAPEYDAIAEPYKASKQLEFRQVSARRIFRGDV